VIFTAKHEHQHEQSDGDPRTAGLLLAWYDREKRTLPWRRDKDPYHVWLSEIMLQQTQVATAIPYFEAFLARWPTLPDLAAASDDQVLKTWEGLGYYSRARNLLAAARLVCERHDGAMPAGEKDRLALPGIGEYTAAAIGAIAFGQSVAAVDGNIVRVFARLTATAWDPTDLAQRRIVRQVVEAVLPADRPGDFNESLMDLGAVVCLPRQPRCAVCPLAGVCRAFERSQTGLFPGKPAAKTRPAEKKVVLVLTHRGRVHVRQRPMHGLLAGLYEFDWQDGASCRDGETTAEALARQFPGAAVTMLSPYVHDFSHKRWLLEACRIDLPVEASAAGGMWVNAAGLQALPFPAALAGYRAAVLTWLGSEFQETLAEDVAGVGNPDES
jgi:A/G-specific adenine glycosylase